MKRLQCIELLTDARIFNGLARDRPDRQCRPSPRIAVEFGQNHPGDTDTGVEALGCCNRILSGHRVGDEQDLIGTKRTTDTLQLGDQIIIYMKPAGGIEYHYVAPVLAGMFDGILAYFDRVGGFVNTVGGNIELFGQYLDLTHGGRPVYIGRNE